MEKLPIKLLYFDTETTGLDPIKNDIIQIAGIIEIDNEVKEEFNFKVQPHSYENISKEALEVNGVTIEQMKEFPTPQETLSKLIKLFDKYVFKFNKTDKFFPVGHNVGFDVNFLFEFCKKCNFNYLGSYLDYHKADTMALLMALMVNNKIPVGSMKLGMACKELAIDLTDAHDALADIRSTRLLWKKLSERIV